LRIGVGFFHAGRRGRLRSQQRREWMTSEKINDDRSRKGIKFAVIVFSIIELVVMVAIIYSRKG